jgi:hypothetical protein
MFIIVKKEHLNVQKERKNRKKGKKISSIETTTHLGKAVLNASRINYLPRTKKRHYSLILNNDMHALSTL